MREIDLSRMEIRQQQSVLGTLTEVEARLLSSLVAASGETVTRDVLVSEIWSGEDDKALESAVGRLRKKLEPEPKKPRYLLTDWGVGYRLLHEALTLQNTAIAFGGMRLVPHSGRLSRDGTEVRLTTAEQKLLVYLARHPGQLCPRGELLSEVWGYHPDTKTRTLETTVNRLRKKIESDPRHPTYLLTVRGQGYRFQPHPTNITAAEPRLIGRRRATDWLIQGLSHDHPLTLLGTAGIGKSAMATHAARHALSTGSYPGGVWWIDLTETDDSGWMEALVLQLRGTSKDGDWAAALHRVLTLRGPQLLILDDADLWPAGSLAVFAESAPGIKLLATSRTPLGMPRERTHTLRALPRSDIAALYRQHLAAGGSAPPDEAMLSSIVDGLDGLPLLIEQATAFARNAGPAALLQALKTPSTLGNRLTRSIERTLSQLTDAEFHDLLPLALYPGTLDPSLVAEILQTSTAEAGRFLDSLCRRSILIEVGAQYRLLHSTREHLRQHLQKTDRLPSASARLEEGVLRRARVLQTTFDGPSPYLAIMVLKEWMPDLMALRDSMRRRQSPRLGRLVAVLWPWLWTGLGRGPAQGWLQGIPSEPDDPDEWWWLLSARIFHNTERGALKQAKHWLRHAMTRTGLSASIRAQRWQASSLIKLLDGDLPGARQDLQRGLMLADGPLITSILIAHQARLFARERELVQAEASYRKAIALATRARCTRKRLTTTRLLSLLLIKRGDFQAAREQIHLALSENWALDFEHSGCLYLLGVLELERGNLAAARQHLHRTLAFSTRSGGRSYQGYTIDNLAMIELIGGSLDKAEEIITDGLERFSDEKPFQVFINLLIKRAYLQHLRGNTAQARRCYRDLQARLTQALFPGALVITLIFHAILEHGTDQPTEARTLLAQAEGMVSAQDPMLTSVLESAQAVLDGAPPTFGQHTFSQVLRRILEA